MFGRWAGARTIIVTLNDGTEVTIRRKKTDFYVDEEENDGGDDGYISVQMFYTKKPPLELLHTSTALQEG